MPGEGVGLPHTGGRPSAAASFLLSDARGSTKWMLWGPAGCLLIQAGLNSRLSRFGEQSLLSQSGTRGQIDTERYPGRR